MAEDDEAGRASATRATAGADGPDAHGPGAPSRRERQRAATEAEIRQVARRQLVASEGTELSLRGIAREMGMTAPGLYRYFDNLSALTEAMCHEYLDEVGGEISAAVAAAGDGTGPAMHAAIRTFRRWATRHPAEFGLLFRSKGPGPVAFPGTEASSWMQQDCPHVQEFASLFLRLFARMWEQDAFPLPDLSHVSPAAVEQAAAFGAAVGADLPAEALMVFAHSWVRLYSVIALEVLGQLAFMFPDAEPYFEAELAAVVRSVGLDYVRPTAEAPGAG